MHQAEWRAETAIGAIASDPLREEERPLEHLHPAERAADHEAQAAHAERVEERGLRRAPCRAP